jgi:hypothetical protein
MPWQEEEDIPQAGPPGYMAPEETFGTDEAALMQQAQQMQRQMDQAEMTEYFMKALNLSPELSMKVAENLLDTSFNSGVGPKVERLPFAEQQERDEAARRERALESSGARRNNVTGGVSKGPPFLGHKPVGRAQLDSPPGATPAPFNRQTPNPSSVSLFDEGAQINTGD